MAVNVFLVITGIEHQFPGFSLFRLSHGRQGRPHVAQVSWMWALTVSIPLQEPLLHFRSNKNQPASLANDAVNAVNVVIQDYKVFSG